MTQINLNLNAEQIQDIISNSGANDLAKQMSATIFNQLMEKDRDDFTVSMRIQETNIEFHPETDIMNEIIPLASDDLS